MSPLTVLHSCPVWLPQTQTWLYNQVRALPADIENHVACLRSENIDQFPCAHLYGMCRQSRLAYRTEALLRRLGLPLHPYWLTRTARRSHAGLLHSHFGNMGWFNLGVARRLRIPHVVTFYGLDVDLLPQQDARWHARYRELFAEVDAVLCEGPHMASRIIAHGCPPSKARVHHLGVDTGAIPFKPRVRLSGEPLRVLIAGAFREKKGIPCALEALGKLQHEVALEITIVGDAGEEPRSHAEKRRILDVIRRHGLGQVQMLGFQPHTRLLEEAYRHHVFLSPSIHAEDGDSEGGAPVSIIEMAASGMPVVSTTHCDIPEVIADGCSGLLAPERDVPGLVERLAWLAAHPQQWERLASAARQHVDTEYNMAVQATRLAALYRSLASQHG
ncbi:MAG: glycosyltransferase [Burkholderiales bacterium]|nr:glycosyltransferase [Burkholderiales bacterium]